MFVNKKNYENINQFRFSEKLKIVNDTLNYDDVQPGGIIFNSNIDLQSPFGYLGALGNFILTDKTKRVLAIGFMENNPIVQRIFIQKKKVSIEELLISFATEVIIGANAAFDVRLIDISNVKGKKIAAVKRK
ncbi:hypothetical protein [Pediococcus claussenii]|uniref:Uncharacterized protein n=1 Tax=Pediococcus claussenii (strain ATCC BAA-344 / DSM 14800 / JCM 18046 / KCTC 3811 / LMG 21948 / P06) TaxID=701521 RepID=G8PER6_PEDCP|nr:hypothetical protein [Pediococcus claussenii]AEV94446.1 hypothetical protein PECL_120 [Pediococcus claussenii ATCC BAA-344]ANZ69666.1 hypothetical protein AYR57_04765 [Pediococcus claussenii]ANZ71483.1 hypothetical protein AYR58_04770 [Pediococcus claussenii]KRN19848.1 hypothetical protein IV79_GL001137 [Pediococcus claussenii]